MVRQLTLALSMSFTVLVAGDAFAVAIVPTDLATWITGPSFLPHIDDVFVTPPTPVSSPMGALGNDVYFDSATGNYTYLETVTPSLANNQLFNTGFSAEGFTGTAGFSFADAAASGGAGAPCLGGGTGPGCAFEITNIAGQLSWYTNFPSRDNPSGWDGGETIRFFYVSTNPPEMGDYNLTTTKVGTGQSYAPMAAVPEPGSLALLGSGIVGLVAAMRRRRRLRA